MAVYDDETIPTDIFYNTLQREIQVLFFQEFLVGAAAGYLSRTALHEVTRDPTFEKMGLRPGFKEFIDRILSRILQFCHLRRCKAEECFKGWHDHGVDGFRFYHPDHLEDFGLEDCYGLAINNGPAAEAGDEAQDEEITDE